MITLIFLMVIGITIFCEYKYSEDTCSCWDLTRFITIPLMLTCFITIIIFMHGLISLRIIDDKIGLYSKQNKEIENKIEVTVKQYMKYENKTFTNLKPDSYINLVNLYPELKSDKLVQKQINVYTKNNNTIIELKQEKLNKTIYKWWLYFGK